MFKINADKSMHITRGDAATFGITASADGGNYTFRAGDVVRFKVFEKKACHCVALEKDFPVAEDTEEVRIVLNGDETKFGDIISKPVDYWYEVELNPETMPNTLIGYDEDGAKLFRVYPEGGEDE